MGIALSEATLALLDGKNYAVLATVNPDGSPQTSVVWVGRDGGDLLFSTVAGRVKHRNMSRDPRVSVTVIDSSDAENYVELRGRVSITPDVGRRVDTELSWKYDGKDPDPDRAGAVRVIVRMVVEKATGYAALTDLTCHHLAQHLIWRGEDLPGASSCSSRSSNAGKSLAGRVYGRAPVSSAPSVAPNQQGRSVRPADRDGGFGWIA
jgi:PPOX class probable F420-dependent enzyme